MPVLTIRNASKRFGAVQAVDRVSLEVQPGSSFGLLGPNGAGKTTLISLIVGTLTPDSGELLFNGQPMTTETKSQIGYVPQELALYEEISATDNLRFFGALYGLEGQALRNAIARALVLAGLNERANEPVSRFSGGMKRRLNIAAGLLHSPKLLILDEPTVGVDPQSRNAIFESIERLKEEGMTLLYTTHYIEEVERLCEQIAVMDHGRIIANDTHAGLQKLLPEQNRVTFSLTRTPHQLPLLDGAISQTLDGNKLVVEIHQLTTDLPKIIASLGATGLDYDSIESRQSSLEEIFLSLTGKALRD